MRFNSNLNNGDTINIDYKNNDKNLTIKIVGKKIQNVK